MLPRFRRGAFALFALVFLVTMLLGDRAAIATATTVDPAAIAAGERWWTPLTALFRYAEGVGMWALLVTLLVQWVLGSRLEGFWGATRYLVMVTVAGVVAYGGVVALGLLSPAIAGLDHAGAAPIDAAAAVAFGFVFSRERMSLGSREVPTIPIAVGAATLAIGFPLLVALVAGTPAAGAWPALIPGLLAGLVATVFVQPWRKRENSGKVGRNKASGQTHLRVVKTPEDMLN